MNDIEVSSIDLVEGGNVFKQGHYLTLGYVPRDENGSAVDLSGKIITVALWERDGIAFESAATYSGGVLRFTLNETVPAGNYQIEFTATSSTDEKYRKKFPTNYNSGRISVQQSADDAGNLGISVYTVAQIKSEQQAAQVAYQEAIDPKITTLTKRVDDGVGAFTEDTEIIDARMGKANLRQFNEGLTTQLADIVKVNVKDFGAKGDGVTDDSEAIKNAILSLPLNNGKLIFPAGIYIHGDGLPGEEGTGNSYLESPTFPRRPLINSTNPVNIGRDIRFRFTGFKNLQIEGYGATVKAHENNGECRNNEIFYFGSCEDLTIKGLKIDGSSHQRQPMFNDYNSGDGAAERGNLRISGGKNIQLIDVTSDYSMIDGIQAIGLSGDTVDTVILTNCHTDFAYRNGVTISTAKNVKVSGGTFTNTGVTFGTAPMAGIDIEADWKGTVNEGVLVENATFHGNVSGAVVFSFGAKNCRVVGCKFEGARQTVGFMFDATRWGYNYVEKCHFINTSLSTETRGVKYVNNVFEVSPTIPAGTYPDNSFYGFFHLQGGDGAKDAFVIMDNNIFNVNLTNVSVDATNVIVGQLWYFGRQNVEFTNNTIINLYSKGTSLNNFRPSYTENSRTTGNRFEFNETRLLETVSNNIFQPIEGRTVLTTLGNIKNNSVNGYSKTVTIRGSYNRLTPLTTGQTYMFSQVLDFNSVYEIDVDLITSGHASLKYDVEVVARSGNTKVVMESDLGNGIKITNYVENKPSIVTPANLFFYKSGKKLYVKATGYYVSLGLKINVHHGNGEYFIDASKNCIRKVTETTISEFTAIPYTVNVPAITNLTDLSNFEKYVGCAVWVTSLAKTAFWNGTAWADANGTIIQ